ncbi:MAG: thioredoxin [Actinobacteria bacterium]|nr:thioredoxin [Actinomycetota bacterium]
MLQTGLEHITSEDEFREVLANNENVMICCGRMGPMCLPVYDVMESIQEDYPQVAFRDMAFDEPVARVIRTLPETSTFRGLPFTVYFKDGEVVHATSSIQSMEQVTSVLDEKF